jgi:hypothetical protein
MPPEQAAGAVGKIDARSDVFGLGAILAVVLTGHPPFAAASAETARVRAAQGDVADCFGRLDDCGADPELVALCKRCLAPRQEDRPADAGEVAGVVAALRAAADERARRAELDRVKAEGERAAAEVRAAEQRKRRRVWFALAAALLVGAAAAVVLAVRARRAEAGAVAERDLKEAARAEAVANEEKARSAEAAQRLELGRTAAAAAQLAAGRGRWEEALRLYDTALGLGGGEEVELRLRRYGCQMALGRLRAAMAELDELAARPDLGRFAGPVLLCRAETALNRQGGDDPRDLARQALASGLPPADAAYARVFLADTAPEAVRQLQEALRHDPLNSRGLESLAMLLFITGRRDEFREVVTQVRMARPDSAGHLIYELFLRGMDGDRAGGERVLAGLAATEYAELVPVLRLFLDVLVRAQDEDFFFGGVPADQFGKFLSEYARMAGQLSRMMGEKDAAEATIGAMRLFQLPMFRALAETPQVKGLTTAGPLGALAMFRQPAKLADLFAAVARAIPDGTFFLFEGQMLSQAGRLTEAEAAFRLALEHPSWANHRRAARFHLAQAQWQLAGRAGAPTEERAAWKGKALANLRDLAFSGKPLPPGPTSALAGVASGCGDPALGLALTEAALHTAPNDLALLCWKLRLELELPAVERAEATARAVAAILSPDAAPARPGVDALLDLARAYHKAGRRGDALRWCAEVRDRLTRAGTDAPDLLDAWVVLGVVYWQMKELDQSIPIFERVHAGRRKSGGDRHPATLHAQINLGVNYRDAGRLEEAIALLEPVDRAGRADPSLRWARGALLTAYVAARKVPEATKLVTEILAEARKEHPAGSPALGAALAEGGGSLLKLGAWGEAEAVLRECLAIREKAQPEAWTTFNARSLLGEALAGQEKFDEAERLLVQGFEGLRARAAQIPQDFRTARLTEAVDRLVEMYTALGNRGEAARWRAERAKYPPPTAPPPRVAGG